MPKKRQLVLIKPAGPGSPPAPLGSIASVRAAFATFNTSPDGDPERAPATTEILHGPGMIAELSLGQDPVTQVLVTTIDDDIAWPVLARICKNLQWKMMDVETGRIFG